MYPYRATFNSSEREKIFQPMTVTAGVFSGLMLNGNSPKTTNRGIPQKYSVRKNIPKGTLSGKKFVNGMNE